jgi:hypothetical protein
MVGWLGSLVGWFRGISASKAICVYHPSNVKEGGGEVTLVLIKLLNKGLQNQVLQTVPNKAGQ